MSVRSTMILAAAVVFAIVPGPAPAGVCFDVSGLPEAASLDLVPLGTGSQGFIQLAGQAQGVCGLGQPPALVQGVAMLDAGGSARLALKLLAAHPGCSGGEADLVLPPPLARGTGQVRLPEGSVANVTLDLDPTGQACQARSPRPSACVANPSTLCLLQHRFRVVARASLQAQGGTQSIPGLAVKYTTESGVFAFSEPSNVEVVLKVLDGRPLNNHYWVVITIPTSAATTNVEYTLTVTDTETGSVKTYSHRPGGLVTPVFDTTAFSASP